MSNVSIVLSTFNGEKYITEQLNSIAQQTYQDITVYIHDDGSSDKTIDKVKDFIRKNNSDVEFVFLDDEDSLKYPQCFITPLIRLPASKYYAFCDQDDVWNPDKIERAVKSLEKVEYDNHTPVLYYSNIDFVDENLNFLHSSRFADHISDVEQNGLQKYMWGGQRLV